jgi:hypothetical protein
MKLDDRARTATDDLLERARRRPVPTLDQLVARRSARRRGLLVVAAAAAIAVVIGVGLLVSSRDHATPPADEPAVVPVPAGVEPQRIELPALGVSMQVPSTWSRVEPITGFAYAWRADDRDAYVTATRVATVPDTDLDSFVRARDAFVGSVGVACAGAARSTIDGHDAETTQCSAQRSTSIAEDIDFTETRIDLGDDTYAVVVAGEVQPDDRSELRSWITSTISVGSVDAIDDTPTAPVHELAPPDGVSVQTVERPDLGFSVQVPSTWSAKTPPPAPLQLAMRSTGPGNLDARRVVASLGSAAEREASLRAAGAAITATADTSIDGHDVHIIRWRMASNRLFEANTRPGGDVLAIVNTEYDIDLGNGDYVLIDIGNTGGATRDLIDWIRSTIHVTV